MNTRNKLRLMRKDSATRNEIKKLMKLPKIVLAELVYDYEVFLQQDSKKR